MPTEWNRQPTGDGLGIATDGKSTRVRWVAAGYLTTHEALASADFPVAYNDPDPDDPTGPRRCRNIRIDATGFQVMTVEATFSVPPDNSDEHPPPEPDPSQPLIFSWQTVQETVAIDRDRSGNAILTTSRRAPVGLTTPMNYKRLTITRWESAYDVDVSLEYENTTNASTFEGGAQGEVKCAIIQPSSSYTASSVLIPIDYVFDFKAIEIWGDHPHQPMFLNQDSYAYIAGPKQVRIVTANGEPVTDVLLDANGKPVDTSLTYFENPGDATPKETPSWATVTLPTGATAVTVGGSTFLRYMRLPEKDFNAFGF